MPSKPKSSKQFTSHTFAQKHISFVVWSRKRPQMSTHEHARTYKHTFRALKKAKLDSSNVCELWTMYGPKAEANTYNWNEYTRTQPRLLALAARSYELEISCFICVHSCTQSIHTERLRFSIHFYPLFIYSSQKSTSTLRIHTHLAHTDIHVRTHGMTKTWVGMQQCQFNIFYKWREKKKTQLKPNHCKTKWKIFTKSEKE